MKQKKTFDAVAFMRKRREELSRNYAGLSAEQIEERVQQSLKNDPLWKKGSRSRRQAPSPVRKKAGGCH
jgi:hypothetical protein